MIGDMKQCHGYLLLLIASYIHKITATNILSTTAGLSLKYKNQIIRNSKPTIACVLI